MTNTARLYARVIAVLVALAIVCIGLLLATYSVPPDEAVLLLHGDKIALKDPTPGLHWKIPLFESVVRLDARTRLVEGHVAATSAETSGFALRYSILWRIADPARYYRGTGGDAKAMRNKLYAAATPVLRHGMAKGDPRSFLTASSDMLSARLEAAARTVAEKSGIKVIGVQIGTADIPHKLAQGVADKMAGGTQREIAAAKAKGKHERQMIAAKASAARARTLADARRKDAKITGASEAKVAAIYAPVAKKAPAFFRYFLALESEGAALKNHTRVLVISMDSPWFKTLQEPKGKRLKHSTGKRHE
jgi:membrane protease subunit HflC